MRSFLFVGLSTAIASGSEVCSADGVCAQDEATLLQMQSLRHKFKDTHHQKNTHGVHRTYRMNKSINKGPFAFVHAGHCAGGWLGDNTNEADLGSCADRCGSNADCGYFSFCDSPDGRGCDGSSNCAIYSDGAGCPDDNNWPAYDSYEAFAGQILGCPNSNPQASDVIAPDRADVRCCDDSTTSAGSGNSGDFPERSFTFIDGTTVDGRDCNAGQCANDDDATCFDDVTFDEAEQICHSVGQRLCTRAEIEARVTCGTGCMHNHHQIWYSDRTGGINGGYSPGEAQFVGCFVDDGSRDMGPSGSGWIGGQFEYDSFDECARACDKAFIALQYGGECFCADSYGNGEQYQQVDISECNRDRAECTSTSFNCGGSWRQAVYQIRPVTGTNSDGCQTSNSYGADEFPPTAQTDPEALGGVRCCSWDASSCQTQDLPQSSVAPIPPPGPADTNQACHTHVTYAKALDVCSEAGMRLCTVAELDTGVCCGTGCWNDHRPIWVQPSCAGLYEAEEANMNGGQVDSNHPGFTGSGFYNPVDNVDDSVEWTLSGCAPGANTLAFTYALSSGSRPTRVFVNDVEVNTAFDMPATGSWNTYGVATLSVDFQSGDNTVKMQVGSSSAPNIDSLTVQ